MPSTHRLTGQYSRDRTISVPRSVSPTRTRPHARARMHLRRHARVHTRALAHTNTPAHAHSVDALTHTAHAVTAVCVIPCGCGGAVEGNDAARSCARFCLAGHCCVRRHDSANSANPVGLLAVREQWYSVRSLLVLKCRSTSRRSMDNDAAACDTGKEMTAECALPCPCASPVPARARRATSRVRPRPCCCGDELCARWCSTQHACKGQMG